MKARIWSIACRELGSYFNHATAYILLVIFLVINFFFFFRDAFLLNEASLRPMLGLLPWLFLFFIPAVCMRSLAEEREAGTLELVLAQPVEVLEFLIGKFVGVYLFLLIAMAGTLGIPVGLSWGADLQVGVILSQYLGSAFLIAAMISVGLFASALTRNQVTAFILGVTISFVLYMIGLPSVVLTLPSFLAVIATRLGILGHFENVARGVIDLRDILYFAAVTAAFMSLTYFSVMRERLSRERESYRRLKLGVLGLVGISIFAALAGGQLRGRLDLTPGKLYTLSKPTGELLQDLDDLVTIKLFQSAELPPAWTPVSRGVDDLLRDFDAAGGGNINLVRLDPDEDLDAQEEASRLGINAAQFNVIGQGEMSIREGYFGLAIQFAGESEIIPLVRQTNDLEYRLASMIRSMTRPDRSIIGMLEGHGEFNASNQMQLASGMLGEEYKIETFTLDSTKISVPDSLDVVVIAGNTTPLDPHEGQLLGEFLDQGGSLMIMISGIQVDFQSLYSGPAFHPTLDALLESKGLGVVPSAVFDIESSEQVPAPSNFGTVFYPYPLWPLGQPAAEHAIVNGIRSVPLRWTSPIQIEVEDSTWVTPLLTTTDIAGRLQTPVSIDPTQNWDAVIQPEDLQAETLAVAYNEPGSGRIVLVGSPAFIQDELLQSSQFGRSGMIFFQNAIDWLAQDEALITIRSKDRAPPQLVFESDVLSDVARYGNMVGVPLLFILFGIMRVARRRRIQQHDFEAGGALL
tara:strand:- start:206 stop:2443 length:2238 start_codon:yes stop_codon:yes gene_type:complete